MLQGHSEAKLGSSMQEGFTLPPFAFLSEKRREGLVPARGGWCSFKLDTCR